MKQNFTTDVTQSILNIQQIHIDVEIKHKKNQTYRFNEIFQKIQVNISDTG